MTVFTAALVTDYLTKKILAGEAWLGTRGFPWTSLDSYMFTARIFRPISENISWKAAVTSSIAAWRTVAIEL